MGRIVDPEYLVSCLNQYYIGKMEKMQTLCCG